MSENPLARHQLEGTVMTNFDHTINVTVADELVADPTAYSLYTAWNFCGYVRWDPSIERWRCDIYRHHILKETLIAKKLETIMKRACNTYGTD